MVKESKRPINFSFQV